MTDEEIICAWMEPRPALLTAAWSEYLGQPSPSGWWIWSGNSWRLLELTLDALHEVEARLIEQMPHNFWLKYEDELKRLRGQLVLWHADAPTRIKALASVLRKEVEG